jgi:hypothetical protein
MAIPPSGRRAIVGWIDLAIAGNLGSSPLSPEPSER